MSLARISSRTPLNSLLPTHHPKSPTTLNFPHLLHTRKPKQRTTFLALVALVFFSTYFFLLHHPEFSLYTALRRADSPAADRLALALESIQNSAANATQRYKSLPKPQQPQVVLDPAQELAAISSFIASLPQNVIPLTVDPSRPIDPELVLDFDTRGPRAAEEVDEMVDDVWLRNPVFLYSKVQHI